MEAAAVTDFVTNVCGHRVNFFPYISTFYQNESTTIYIYLFHYPYSSVFLSFTFNLYVYGDCFFPLIVFHFDVVSQCVYISVSECVHSIDLYVRYIRVDETFSFHLVSFSMCALSNKRARSSNSKIFLVSFCAILKRENEKREMSQRNAIHATWLQRSLLFAFARTQTHTNERTVYNNNADAAFKKRIRLMIL